MILTCPLFGFGCVTGFITVSGAALAFLFWRARRAAQRHTISDEPVPALLQSWAQRRGLDAPALLRREARTPLLKHLEGADMVLAFVIGDAQRLWTKPYVGGIQ